MTEQQYAQALSQQLDMIADFKRCLADQQEHGTDLGVKQYQQLIGKLFQELDALMTLAPDHLKHEVIVHQE
ncbi:hypothetical protein [Spirosoma koreense]